MFDEPIAIVSCVGPYRCGKSFLLNQILLQEKCFKVSSESNACTRGIWLSQKTVTHDGKRIFVLDSEGVKSTNANQQTDNVIFCLCILLSSMLIYNTKSCIDSGALEDLHLALECSKLLSTDETDMFPSFTWLLRDVGLQLMDEHIPHKKLTPNEYLEQKLVVDSENDSRKNLKEAISGCFKTRQCFAMSYPKVENISQLSEMSQEQLPTQFQSEMKSLRDLVLRTTPYKTIQGKKITGRMFLNLCLDFTDAINEGKLPSPKSSWTTICDSMFQVAKNDTKKWVQEQMHALPLLPPQQFDNSVKNIYQQAKLFFQKKTKHIRFDREEVEHFFDNDLHTDCSQMQKKNRQDFYHKLENDSKKIKSSCIATSTPDFKKALMHLYQKMDDVQKQNTVDKKIDPTGYFAIMGILRVEKTDVISMYEKRQSQHDIEMDKMKKMIETLTTDKNNLERNLHRLSQTCEKTEIENKKLIERTKAMDALESKANEAEVLQKNLSEITKKYTATNLSLEKAESLCQENQKSIDSLNKEITKMKQDASLFDETNTKYNQIENEIKELKKLREKEECAMRFEMDKDHMQMKHERVLKSITEDHTIELESVEETNAMLKDRMQKMHATIKANEAEMKNVDVLKSNVQALKKQNETLKEENTTKTQKLRDLISTSHQLKLDLDRQKTNTVPESELKAEKKQNMHLNYALELEKQDVADLKKQTDSLRKELNTLKRKRECESSFSF